MYSHRTGLTIGFHGCDLSVSTKVIGGTAGLRVSENNYDWLGHGIYFWEYSPQRAMDFAMELAVNPRSGSKIKIPSVIGAVIDLGHCLDLLDYENLSLLAPAYNIVVESNLRSGLPIPQNKCSKDSNDHLIRELDCAVMEIVHKVNGELKGTQDFDSVRGVFFEGNELYPNSGFRGKDHIQICIRNPNCIKGYFWPREIDKHFHRV